MFQSWTGEISRELICIYFCRKVSVWDKQLNLVMNEVSLCTNTWNQFEQSIIKSSIPEFDRTVAFLTNCSSALLTACILKEFADSGFVTRGKSISFLWLETSNGHLIKTWIINIIFSWPEPLLHIIWCSEHLHVFNNLHWGSTSDS